MYIYMDKRVPPATDNSHSVLGLNGGLWDSLMRDRPLLEAGSLRRDRPLLEAETVSVSANEIGVGVGGGEEGRLANRDPETGPLMPHSGLRGFRWGRKSGCYVTNLR